MDEQDEESIYFDATGTMTGLELMGQLMYIGGLPGTYPLDQFSEKSEPFFVLFQKYYMILVTVSCAVTQVCLCVCVRADVCMCVHVCVYVHFSVCVCVCVHA